MPNPKTNTKNLSCLTWLRVVSVLMILACHYVQQNPNAYIRLLAQFFNIGVQLFFILSGFLAGYRGVAKPYGLWYRKRMQRIYIPFWIFLSVLAIVHMTKGLNVLTADWLLLALGLQGSLVRVWGAEQTWFLSVLLLCYLLTPILSEIADRFFNRIGRVAVLGCLTAVCLIPICYAFCEQPWVYTVFTPVSFYIAAFFAGYHYDSQKPVSARMRWISVCVIFAAFALRLLVRGVCDGTILYDRIVVPYTQFIAAGAIFCLFGNLFTDRAVPRPIQLISDISFEIYLYHYMFTVGPISIFGKTHGWLTDCAVTTLVAMVMAFCASKLNNMIIRLIPARQKMKEASPCPQKFFF